MVDRVKYARKRYIANKWNSKSCKKTPKAFQLNYFLSCVKNTRVLWKTYNFDAGLNHDQWIRNQRLYRSSKRTGKEMHLWLRHFSQSSQRCLRVEQNWIVSSRIKGILNYWGEKSTEKTFCPFFSVYEFGCLFKRQVEFFCSRINLFVKILLSVDWLHLHRCFNDLKWL